MNKNEAKDLIRDLINKIYNEPNLTCEILDEVEVDLKEIFDLVGETSFSRELNLFIKSARGYDDLASRSHFKFLILSNLEKRYQRICRLEEK